MIRTFILIFFVFIQIGNAQEMSQSEMVNKTFENENSELLERLFAGADVVLEDAMITNQIAQKANSSFFVLISLTATSAEGDIKSIDLYKSDDILNKGEGYLPIHKEISISGIELFKILEPHINLIHEAAKLNLTVTLNQNEKSNLNRNVSQSDILNSTHDTLYQLQLNPSTLVKDFGFMQNIDLPENFSHADNSEITDLGFSIFFK